MLSPTVELRQGDHTGSVLPPPLRLTSYKAHAISFFLSFYLKADQENMTPIPTDSQKVREQIVPPGVSYWWNTFHAIDNRV